MKIAVCILFALTALFPVGLFASESEVSASLDNLAKELVRSHRTALPDGQSRTMAILPFHTSGQLAKRKTGNALAEFLMHSFRKYPEFKLTERAELNKLLSELRLGASGAIDPEKALEAGRLSGASLQLFGSMEQIGEKYHINARIVKSETGEVVATAYTTIPAELFDEESAYLGVIPAAESRIFGIYTGYIFRSISNPTTITYTDGSTGYSVASNPDSLNDRNLSYEFGVRYSPSPRIQLDYSYSVLNYNQNFTGAGYTAIGKSAGGDKDFSIRRFRLLAAYKHSLNKKFKSYSGIGICVYSLEDIDRIILNGNGRIESRHFKKRSARTPVIYERLEYRIQSRLAFEISASYEFRTMGVRILNSPAGELQRLYFEPALSVYF